MIPTRIPPPEQGEVRRGSPSAGFTLLEILIVLALTSVIAVVLLKWQIQQEASLQHVESRLRRTERATTALAYLRKDLARTDTLLPGLSDVQAGPGVLILSRRLRDAHGFARQDQAYVVYQLLDGRLHRTTLDAHGGTLAQPVGDITGADGFALFDVTGHPVSPDHSRQAQSVRVGGHQFRLGGSDGP